MQLGIVVHRKKINLHQVIGHAESVGTQQFLAHLIQHGGKMKLTRRQLRKLIQEVYQMTPDDEQNLKRQGIEKGGMMDTMARSLLKTNPDLYRVNITNMRRAKGRQYPEEIEADRAALQRIHNSSEYQSIVNAFQSGAATAIYDLTYQGTFTSGRKEVITNIPEWISRYGHKTNDSISTKAFLGKIQDIPASIGEPLGIGVIIRGYPVLVSSTDAYSQTYSASPQGLIDHQASSGFAKRGDITNAIYSVDDWMVDDEEAAGEAGISHETILDNWRIVGAVVNEDIFNQVNREDLGIDELDMPVHIISANGTYKGLI